MILQHNCHCQNPELLRELTEVSRFQHAKYAAAHGYVYEMSDGNFLPKEGWGGQGYMNKVHLLLKVILAELDRADPVEWVMLADTDTLIIDPSVNIHELLPPSETRPTPMTLGNRDLNGFNAGVVIWKVDHHTVTFLARMLTMEFHVVDPTSSDKPQPQYVSWVPSDQWLIALVLQNYKDARDHFYEIPQDWFSSYFDPISWPNITEAVPSASVRGWIHMAGTLKTDWDWKKFLDLPEGVFELAGNVARDMGLEGTGLDLMPGAEKARREAEEWWKVTKNGIDSMSWFTAYCSTISQQQRSTLLILSFNQLSARITSMRGSIIALTTFLVASTLAGASQLPLGEPSLSKMKSDPSFPQPGVLGFDRPKVQDGQGATLAEALTIDRKAGVWWDYARDVTSVTARLSARGSKDTTILVPVDSAIMRMPRKPHQSEGGADTEETMKQNVEKFLSAHIVPSSIDMPTSEPAQTLLDDLSVEIVQDENKEGGWRVNPGDIEVLDVKQAANGRILYLNGVIQA